jgi:hypothetical protein
LYNGKPLKEINYKIPEINKMYPSVAYFHIIYRKLKQEAELTGEHQYLDISENSIKINGKETLSKA